MLYKNKIKKDSKYIYTIIVVINRMHYISRLYFEIVRYRCLWLGCLCYCSIIVCLLFFAFAVTLLLYF